jgi:hypothetical protein
MIADLPINPKRQYKHEFSEDFTALGEIVLRLKREGFLKLGACQKDPWTEVRRYKDLEISAALPGRQREIPRRRPIRQLPHTG